MRKGWKLPQNLIAFHNNESLAEQTVIEYHNHKYSERT